MKRYCADCNHVYETVNNDLHCPKCQSDNTHPEKFRCMSCNQIIDSINDFSFCDQSRSGNHVPWDEVKKA